MGGWGSTQSPFHCGKGAAVSGTNKMVKPAPRMEARSRPFPETNLAARSLLPHGCNIWKLFWEHCPAAFPTRLASKLCLLLAMLCCIILVFKRGGIDWGKEPEWRLSTLHVCRHSALIVYIHQVEDRHYTAPDAGADERSRQQVGHWSRLRKLIRREPMVWSPSAHNDWRGAVEMI